MKTQIESMYICFWYVTSPMWRDLTILLFRRDSGATYWIQLPLRRVQNDVELSTWRSLKRWVASSWDVTGSSTASSSFPVSVHWFYAKTYLQNKTMALKGRNAAVRPKPNVKTDMELVKFKLSDPKQFFVYDRIQTHNRYNPYLGNRSHNEHFAWSLHLFGSY